MSDMKRYVKSSSYISMLSPSRLQPGMKIHDDIIRSVNTTNSGYTYVEFESGNRDNFSSKDLFKCKLKYE